LAVAPSGRALEFETAADGREIDLVPLCRLFDERYAVYGKVARAGA